MTLSVPYSFVPGTKAKADEVNANFIAVLDKIEKNTSDIEDLSTNNLTKLNVDLSNIDEEGQKVLDAKADKTEIDGKWVYTNVFIAQNVTVTLKYDTTFDISSFLPADGEIYDVIVSAIIRTGTALGNCTGLFASSTLSGSICMCRAVTRVNNTNQIAAGNCTIPIAADRKLRFFSGSESTSDSMPGGCSFRISAYRKVR